MRGRTVFVAAVSTLLLVVAWIRPAPEPEAEVGRIDAHLARVIDQMRADPPTGLDDRQRRLRAETLDWLDEYRRAGVFPHNHVREGERVPVFVDPHGTPCAVGYLLLRSGHPELVEEIVRTDNLVRVAELEGEPRLSRWLDERGLTLDEAARIQPAYGPGPDPTLVEPESSYYEEGTVATTILTAAIASWAAMGDPDPGFGWVDAAALGTLGVHSWLLLSERPDDARYGADIANVAGIAASGLVVALRALAPGVAEVPVGGARVLPFVAPGSAGTRLGLTIR